MKRSTDSNQPFRGQRSLAVSFPLSFLLTLSKPVQVVKYVSVGVFRCFSRKGSRRPTQTSELDTHGLCSPGSLSLKEDCSNQTVKTLQQSIYKVCVPNYETTTCSLLRIQRQLLDCYLLDCKFINYISATADCCVMKWIQYFCFNYI